MNVDRGAKKSSLQTPSFQSRFKTRQRCLHSSLELSEVSGVIYSSTQLLECLLCLLKTVTDVDVTSGTGKDTVPLAVTLPANVAEPSALITDRRRLVRDNVQSTSFQIAFLTIIPAPELDSFISDSDFRLLLLEVNVTATD